MEQISRVKFSKARAYEKANIKIFEQFLDNRTIIKDGKKVPNRVECGAAIFYVCCKLEIEFDNEFKFNQILEYPDILEGNYKERTLRRTLLDLERLGLISKLASGNKNQKFYKLTVSTFASALVKQSKNIRAMYKKIHTELKNDKK